ncbi:MAG: fumarylacetoacetate hydrolase family protein [Bacteroidales bacterium]|nr:fumarylacetoacetate hydrolase family protein [Bacteroidales bacterium]
MKIICIGRNYIEHARELNNAVPEKPIFFMKPDSALLTKNKPFFLPPFSTEVHHEVELVLKISRLGKHIDEKYARRYYGEISIGIDFTARDLQRECKQKGLPWEIAKAFDGSAPVGEFLPKNELSDPVLFHLDINGETVQQGSTADLIFSFDKVIAYISQYITLRTGDLIFTGTPAGVGPVKKDDRLQAYIGDRLLLDFMVK